MSTWTLVEKCECAYRLGETERKISDLKHQSHTAEYEQRLIDSRTRYRNLLHVHGCYFTSQLGDGIYVLHEPMGGFYWNGYAQSYGRNAPGDEIRQRISEWLATSRWNMAGDVS